MEFLATVKHFVSYAAVNNAHFFVNLRRAKEGRKMKEEKPENDF